MALSTNPVTFSTHGHRAEPSHLDEGEQIGNSGSVPMVPLYAARIEDLGPGDFVRVECIACHNELITAPAHY